MNVQNLLNALPVSFVAGASNNSNNVTAGRMPVSHSQSPPPISATLLWNQRSGQWGAEIKDLLHGEVTVGADRDSSNQIDLLSKEQSVHGMKVYVNTNIDDQGQSKASFKVLDKTIHLDIESYEQRENKLFSDFIRSHIPAPTPSLASGFGLPFELKLNVLSHLSPADKKSLRLSDRAWCAMITPELTHLPIDGRAKFASLARFLQDARQITSLNVKKLTLSDANSATTWVTNAEVKQLADILKRHPHITELDLSDCSSVTNPALGSLRQAVFLQKLTLSNCKLTDPAFRHFKSGNDNVQPFPRLTHLDVSRCSRIKSIEHVGGLPALKHLNLDYCEKLEDVSALQTMQLETLSANSVNALGNNMTYLNGMRNLKSLNMNFCRPPQGQLQVLQHLTALEQLNLSYATMSPDILQHIGSLPDLKDLRLERVTLHASALPHLASLSGTLEKLDLTLLRSADGSRGRLPALENFSKLTALSLAYSEHGVTEDLSDLEKLTGLEYLNVSNWPGLTDYMVTEHILPLQELTCLVVNDCTNLTEASFRCFAELPKLEILGLRGCNVPENVLRELKKTIPNVITDSSSMVLMP